MSKDRLMANPRTPRTPFPVQFESLRKAALGRWGDASISREEILQWVCAGCPDGAGALLNAATCQSPPSGQAQSDPDAFVAQLLNSGVFIPKR